MQNKEIRLASRPVGVPTDENFQLVETEVPSIADGEVLLRSLYISVDPYLRGRMRESKSYVPPFQLGQVIESGVVSEVMESKSPDFKKGDVVSAYLGWRLYNVANARQLMRTIPGVCRPVRFSVHSECLALLRTLVFWILVNPKKVRLLLCLEQLVQLE